MTVIMDYGESRHIKLMIHNCRGDEFEIVRAEFEFTPKGADIPEASGLASIVEHIIDIAVTPRQKGTYTLKVTYHIADETLIDTVEVQVI